MRLRQFTTALVLALGACSAFAAAPTGEQARWKASAKNVTILRDTWGIPHVFGKSDADAVFGLLYAQAEDDFNRVELNYINAFGRLAEVEGEGAVWRDLRVKLYNSPARMKAQYAASPVWLKKLMVSFADGLNYYLHTHPEVRPKLITRFEPWMALAFSEGSIGGDYESIDLHQLEKFYSEAPVPPPLKVARECAPAEPGGSNGFAIAPQNSASGNALLLINPHTSFYFRPEVHVQSREGLNAYGAVTWGQFFVYQGFNERAGWMHTSFGGDTIDEFLLDVTMVDGRPSYRYGKEQRPLSARTIVVPYKSAGGMASKTVTAWFSHHGPVVRTQDGKWVAFKMMDEPLKALMQSYERTKAKNYKQFLASMQLRANSSNNTVYADADGTIAYFHGNFIPRRDPRFDYTRPVDGSDPATDWQAPHEVSETITLHNPSSGFLFNTNNWPCRSAGAASPRCEDYPAYMVMKPENWRGIHAQRVLDGKAGFTLDSLTAAAYDNYLTIFDPLIPALAADFDANPVPALAPQVNALRNWDRRSGVDSVPTALGVYWVREMVAAAGPQARAARKYSYDYITSSLTPAARLDALARASARLEADFGSWQTPWGQINRFQRPSGDVELKYDDAAPSLPVPFTSSDLGSLAAFGVTSGPGNKRLYGEKGNSFVAVVEFGPKLKARTSLAGGNSGNPASPHFMDQAADYANGKFKDVWFYKADIEAHLERRYHPGK